MSEELVLIRDPKCTALVVIDLQHGIVGRTPAPHSGPDVVARCNAIAGALRKAGGTIFWFRVTPSPDGKDALMPPTDAPNVTSADRPANWAELVPEVDKQPGDFLLTKRQWGAFYGTELDL